MSGPIHHPRDQIVSQSYGTGYVWALRSDGLHMFPVLCFQGHSGEGIYTRGIGKYDSLSRGPLLNQLLAYPCVYLYLGVFSAASHRGQLSS